MYEIWSGFLSLARETPGGACGCRIVYDVPVVAGIRRHSPISGSVHCQRYSDSIIKASDMCRILIRIRRDTLIPESCRATLFSSIIKVSGRPTIWIFVSRWASKKGERESLPE